MDPTRDANESRHAALGDPQGSGHSRLHAASARANEAFRCFAHKISVRTGSPVAFALALGTIVVWSLAGPVFGFSDTWQLVINTSTTIVTFLMVFLVQATQNRDSEAIHLKLDELLRAVSDARSSLIDVESLPEYKLEELRSQFRRISREKSRSPLSVGAESPPRVEQPDEDSRRVG